MLRIIFVWWRLVEWHAAGGIHAKKSEIICWHDDQILIHEIGGMLTVVLNFCSQMKELGSMKLRRGSVGGIMKASKFLSHKALILHRLQHLRIHFMLQDWSATSQGLTLQLVEMHQRNELVSNNHVNDYKTHNSLWISFFTSEQLKLFDWFVIAVPMSPKPPTNSLRIDRFLRPFTLKAVQELLAKTGNVCSFWMDHIKTHCYVTVKLSLSLSHTHTHTHTHTSSSSCLLVDHIADELQSWMQWLRTKPAISC